MLIDLASLVKPILRRSPSIVREVAIYPSDRGALIDVPSGNAANF